MLLSCCQFWSKILRTERVPRRSRTKTNTTQQTKPILSIPENKNVFHEALCAMWPIKMTICKYCGDVITEARPPTLSLSLHLESGRSPHSGTYLNIQSERNHSHHCCAFSLVRASWSRCRTAQGLTVRHPAEWWLVGRRWWNLVQMSNREETQCY